ncbi:MAG TPA: hypothetical protein VF695_14970 [Sphingomonas sp.]
MLPRIAPHVRCCGGSTGNDLDRKCIGPEHSDKQHGTIVDGTGWHRRRVPLSINPIDEQPSWRNLMGTIADELELQQLSAHTMLGIGSPFQLVVISPGLIASPPQGNVLGAATAQIPQLNAQLMEISKALKHASAAIRKLEDKIKVLENTNPATGRPLPPVGFRKQ